MASEKFPRQIAELIDRGFEQGRSPDELAAAVVRAAYPGATAGEIEDVLLEAVQESKDGMAKAAARIDFLERMKDRARTLMDDGGAATVAMAEAARERFERERAEREKEERWR